MPQTIRKVVFPVAGLGTRFLPATKAVPKEMLPVVDRPLIQWAVEEAAAAGCDEFIFVTSPHKRAILEHFSPAPIYQETLEARGKHDELALLQAGLPENAKIREVYQDKPLGLGHAIWCAREAVGDDRPRERSRLGLAAVRGARRSARGSARDTSGVAREVNARARPRRASDASDASARGRPNSSPERVEWV